MCEVKRRIEQVIQTLGISTREFERLANLSVGFVRSIRQNISPLKQESIKRAFPCVNMTWILTGEGDMLHNIASVQTNMEDNLKRYMESTVKDRLKEFISYKGISVSRFQDIVGVSNSFVASINQSIAPKTQKRISSSFPELNMAWLILGEGEMLHEIVHRSTDDSIAGNNTSIRERFKQYAIYKHIRSIREMERNANLPNGFIATAKIISNARKIQISEAYPDLDMVWLTTGIGDMIKRPDYDCSCEAITGNKSIKERILAYIATKGLSKSSFERSAGMANGYINNMRSMGQSSIDKIASAFPDLNMGWLLTGEGEMLRSTPVTQTIAESTGSVNIAHTSAERIHINNQKQAQSMESSEFLQKLVDRLMGSNEALVANNTELTRTNSRLTEEIASIKVTLEQQAAKMREMESALGCSPAHSASAEQEVKNVG